MNKQHLALLVRSEEMGELMRVEMNGDVYVEDKLVANSMKLVKMLGAIADESVDMVATEDDELTEK